MLNDRGILHWDDPVLLRALGRVSGMTFNIPEDIDDDPSIGRLKEKVKDACAMVWSKEVYRNWANTNNENTQKKFADYTSEFRNDTNQARTLSSMLRLWSSGTKSDLTNPVKFEAYIATAIENGLMMPKDRFYYLIMGVATKDPDGKSLLSKEAFLRLADLESIILLCQRWSFLIHR